MKKIVYIDLDNVIVDFPSAFPHIDPALLQEYADRKDDIPGIFKHMLPVSGAVESFSIVAKYFDTYILSTAPWMNPSAWSDKLQWVQRYLDNNAYKRLILTHHKNLNSGDYLIDDREKNGAKEFNGKLILFGCRQYPNWAAVLEYLFKEKLISDDPSLLYEYDCGRRANIEEFPEDAQALIRMLRKEECAPNAMAGL